MPGISGSILQMKAQRDEDARMEGGTSIWVKIAGYMTVGAANAGMLFYVFLFALRQTKFRQDAWFRSFMIWLGLDIILVCTMVVIFSNIMLPSFIMKDLSKIKERLLSTVEDYKRRLGQVRENGEEKTRDDPNVKEFNAAEYLFVSIRLAKMDDFKHLPLAKIIVQFSTPWPRQSYLHVENSNEYSTQYFTLSRSVSTLAAFVIGSFIQLPTSIQDSTMYMVLSTACGYLVLLLAQLYMLYPALIAIPIAVSLVLCHYLIKAITAMRKTTAREVAPTTAPMAGAQSHSNKREPPMNSTRSMRIENDGDRLNSQTLFPIVAPLNESNVKKLIGSSDLDSNSSIFDCSFSSREDENGDRDAIRSVGSVGSVGLNITSVDLLSRGDQDSDDLSSGYDSV